MTVNIKAYQDSEVKDMTSLSQNQQQIMKIQIKLKHEIAYIKMVAYT